MVIDLATRESLELTRAVAGGRTGSLLASVDRTVTGAGARLLAADVGAPLLDLDKIQARLDLVTLFERQPAHGRGGHGRRGGQRRGGGPGAHASAAEEPEAEAGGRRPEALCLPLLRGVAV